MYRKGWRYYRDSTLLWATFFIVIAACGVALRNPIYWIMAISLWMLRMPFRKAFFFAHPFKRFDWLGETYLDFRAVTFKSRDGLTLFGRFHPSRNQATVLLLHGLGDVNSNMLIYAEFLAKAGYGVFMIDLRAHGSSDGDTSTFGLREADDVAGAVDYLLTRADVNGAKIGALGISLGAQAALQGALKTEKIHALALEALGPSMLWDYGGMPKSFRHWIDYPFNWLYYRIYEFMIGGRCTGVLETIGKITPHPILLIAGSAKDIYFSRLFYQAANEPKELWEFPNGEHSTGIQQDSRTYAQRVVAFFDKALL